MPNFIHYIIHHFQYVARLIMVFCLAFPSTISGQLMTDYPHDIIVPPYVNLAINRIEFPGNDSSAFIPIFEQLENYLKTGEANLSFVHFGGSHIQADIYPQVFRERMNQYFEDIVRDRGIVFPYNIARSNDPLQYTDHSTGHWYTCRNVESKKHDTLGVLGICAITNDSLTTIQIHNKINEPPLHFSEIKIFFKTDSSTFDINLKDSSLVISKQLDSTNNIITFNLLKPIDTLNLIIARSDTNHGNFTLYGIELLNKTAGLTYHSIGINGASVPSFLRCELFTQQLTYLHPDLVIMSIGTNDGYGKKFTPESYYNNLDTLIQNIYSANPKAAILLTVPNDDYYHKRYPNRNTEKQEKIIYNLAKRYKLGVWNLYKMMGGFNSSLFWYRDHLMRYDRIHFTNTGYHLKGDLFFSAFLKSFDNYLSSKQSKTYTTQ